MFCSLGKHDKGLKKSVLFVLRKALRMAREVADETGTLVGGNICNSGIFETENPESIEKVESIFKVCHLNIRTALWNNKRSFL